MINANMEKNTPVSLTSVNTRGFFGRKKNNANEEQKAASENEKEETSQKDASSEEANKEAQSEAAEKEDTE